MSEWVNKETGQILTDEAIVEKDKRYKDLQDEVVRLRRAVYTIFRAAKSSQYRECARV